MHRTVSDVMTTPVVSVAPATSFKELVRLLHRHRIGALPVVDPDQRLLGIVSETDLALKEERPADQPASILAFARPQRRRDHAKAHGTVAAAVMSAPVATVPPGASLRTAARLLHQRGI